VLLRDINPINHDDRDNPIDYDDRDNPATSISTQHNNCPIKLDKSTGTSGRLVFSHLIDHMQFTS
jgi:hypothetical protein